jgi:hypothetical protein
MDYLYEQEQYMQEASGLADRSPVDEVYDQMFDIQLRRDMDFSDLEEITFWAHDDTLEPRSTYRYRVRLGVFCPSPGPDSDQAILWSDFSSITDPIHVPGRMYFFATDTQDAETAVKVQVSKYVLGHWYSEQFKVKSGEVIGDVRELEDKSRSRTPSSRTTSSAFARPGLNPSLLSTSRPKDMVTEPEEIDYKTGALLVDISTVEDWAVGTKMSPRQYKNMLYSYDTVNIEHMGIGRQFWPAELQTAFGDILVAQRQPREPFKDWDSNKRRRQPMPGFEYDGGEMTPEMYEEMMMMEMGNY